MDLGPVVALFSVLSLPFFLLLPSRPLGWIPDLFHCLLHLGLLTALPATCRCYRTVTWSVRALPVLRSCSAPVLSTLVGQAHLLLSDTVIQETSLPNAILSLLFWDGPALLLKFQIWETVAKHRSSKIKREHLENQSYSTSHVSLFCVVTHLLPCIPDQIYCFLSWFFILVVTPPTIFHTVLVFDLFSYILPCHDLLFLRQHQFLISVLNLAISSTT